MNTFLKAEEMLKDTCMIEMYLYSEKGDDGTFAANDVAYLFEC